MKTTDLHTEARRNWLRNEQTSHGAPSTPARQSNFEKSKLFRWTVVACLLFVVVNVFQDDPVVTPTTPYHVTV
ncbi:hypothetical protein QZN29_11305 [Burkholderia multivorans]|uniref:hypothetical protein n=1 Tax=Burkholderia multivorans TaxID=87883 RepID=UPI0021BF8DE8|nr:hypothetical protein [Burkholderia multivorans]MDN8092065.1 hypothetical protein [Burkholderia multivorans]MDN8097456.1 hypothetical protein [Burkholderia multivorans]MDN8109022.1 hypothetical protein [Burkholderia multivorans]MDN8125080.1 hypothetical protein [Burkholderia multivorans]MDN8132372.1 hypothetical protein [Burkholderia multivorans]